MNMIEKEIFLGYIRETLAKDPSLFSRVIDSATEGVKQFADSQKNMTGQMAFKLYSVLDQIDVPADGKFGPFDVSEILDLLSNCHGGFGGTKGMEQLKEKYGVV